MFWSKRLLTGMRIIEQLNEVVQEKDETITQLNGTVQEKDQAIEQLQGCPREEPSGDGKGIRPLLIW